MSFLSRAYDGVDRFTLGVLPGGVSVGDAQEWREKHTRRLIGGSGRVEDFVVGLQRISTFQVGKRGNPTLSEAFASTTETVSSAAGKTVKGLTNFAVQTVRDVAGGAAAGVGEGLFGKAGKWILPAVLVAGAAVAVAVAAPSFPRRAR